MILKIPAHHANHPDLTTLPLTYRDIFHAEVGSPPRTLASYLEQFLEKDNTEAASAQILPCDSYGFSRTGACRDSLQFALTQVLNI